MEIQKSFVGFFVGVFFFNRINLGIPNMENNHWYFSVFTYLMGENLLPVVIISITVGQIFVCVCVTIP